MAEGIKIQIEENKDFEPLTIEKINQVLGEVFRSDRVKQDTFAMYQGCKTKGTVLRTEKDLGLCGDPECPSCSELAKMVHEEMKKEPNILNSNFK